MNACWHSGAPEHPASTSILLMARTYATTTRDLTLLGRVLNGRLLGSHLCDTVFALAEAQALAAHATDLRHG